MSTPTPKSVATDDSQPMPPTTDATVNPTATTFAHPDTTGGDVQEPEKSWMT